MLPGLSIVLLTYNEAQTIARVLSSAVALRKHAKRYEIIVVQYAGSTDGTEQIVRAFAAKHPHVRVVRQPREQRGYGVALRMGIAAAKMEYVFYSDADGQFRLEEFPVLLPFAADFDIVSGYRRKRRDPFGRILTATVYRFLLRLVFGLRMRDVDSAFKLYRRRIFDVVKIASRGGFVDGEILIKAKHHGFRIREVPVHHYPRFGGTSNYGTGFVKFSVVTDALSEMFALWRAMRK